MDDRPQLQADEDEGKDVQDEHHHLPHGVGRNAQPSRHARRGAAGGDDRVSHDGDDAGEPEPLGEDPDAERGEELDDDRGCDVAYPSDEEEREARQGSSDKHAAHRHDRKQR